MPTPARVVILPQQEAPLSVEEIALPDPGEHQVVVKQFASGICHSQLHQMHAASRPGHSVLGHESTGVVLKAGKGVKHVKEGDTVMVTWVPRNDEEARRESDLITLERPGGAGVATTRNVFTWADHTIADSKYIVPIPSQTKMDVTAIIGCAVMTGSGAVYHTAGVKKGQSVAIFGVGGVGLSAVVAAKVVGANPIIAVDLDEKKLDFAKRFGASHTVNASGGNAVEQIHELTRDASLMTMMGTPVSGVDFAFDCIGRKVTMEQIVPAARSAVLGATTGGTAVLVGVPQESVELDARDVLINEKKFIGSIGGSCSPDRDFPMFLRWYEDGELDLDALVTERFHIEQINEATSALANGEIFGRAIMEFN